jgi:hypothetical protein
LEIREFDEFGIFVTDIHVRKYVNDLLSKSFDVEKIYNLCIIEFGEYNKQLILSILNEL